jgi:hypothetical protein
VVPALDERVRLFHGRHPIWLASRVSSKLRHGGDFPHFSRAESLAQNSNTF